ncbi:hypothetical protein [Planococcus rifietoensis]|uniref:hypothetical protein n=1 Tax=Planococcus rifietoensis TaxID=200991 RepID=UPI00384A8DF2
MKKNFYFWSTWLLLITMILLIFWMYQNTFNFSEIIDLKTILQVLGTFLGAMIGAKMAGQYAVKAVKEQISYEESKRENEYDQYYNYAVRHYKKLLNPIYELVQELENQNRQDLKDERVLKDVVFSLQYEINKEEIIKKELSRIDKSKLKTQDLELLEAVEKVYNYIISTKRSCFDFIHKPYFFNEENMSMFNLHRESEIELSKRLGSKLKELEERKIDG